MSARRGVLVLLGLVLAACRDPAPPPVPAAVALDAGIADSAAVGTAVPVTARVTAENGRPVRGVTVSFAVSAGAGSVAPLTAVTDRDGRATTTWTLGTLPVTNGLTALVPELPLPAREDLRAVPGPPARLDVARPPAARSIAGIAVEPAAGVRVMDRFGNGVGGVPVRFTVAAGDGAIGAPTVTTGRDGLALVDRWTTGRTPGANTVLARVDGLAEVPLTIEGEAFNATIDGVQLNQGSQRLAGDIGGVSGRPALLRVLVRGDRAPNPFTPAVRVRLWAGGVLRSEHRIEARGGTIPTVTPLEERTTAWDLWLPADAVVPGLQVEALLDPEGTLPDADRSDDRFPRGETLHDLDVRPLAPLRVTFFPMTSTSNGATGNITPANLGTFLTATQRWIPSAAIEATLREPFITDADFTQTTQWSAALSALQALRTAEGAADAYYHGIVPGIPGVAYGGLAYLPGASSSPFRSGLSYDRANAAEVVAHELGHNLGRPHAPCGSVGSSEPAFPHANARLGSPGVDILAPGSALIPVSHADYMSYCGPKWTSDHAYARILSWRRTDARVPLADRPALVQPVPALLVWGRLTAAGPVLEPAVTLEAVPTAAVAGGTARLRGLTADGRVLFDVAVEAVAVDHAADATERHIAHVVPLSAAEAATLDRIELSADGRTVQRRAASVAPTPVTAPLRTRLALEGGERLRWDAQAHPALFLRDPRTGHLTGLLRSGDARLDAASAARGLQVLVSDGLRTVRVE
jgi:hypothetical protein